MGLTASHWFIISPLHLLKADVMLKMMPYDFIESDRFNVCQGEAVARELPWLFIDRADPWIVEVWSLTSPRSESMSLWVMNESQTSGVSIFSIWFTYCSAAKTH